VIRACRGWVAVALLGGGLAGCGDASVHSVDAAARDGGPCGTHANPGILKIASLAPALGATVNNQGIAHGFTVSNAPAQFSNFKLAFGSTHTAGIPTPANPTFQLTTVGSDIIYQLTIESWSRSPAHVELSADRGFDTAAGCTWEFPSPLFSYDIVGGPDGGAGVNLDGGARWPLDVALDSTSLPVDGAVDGRSPPVDSVLDLGLAPDAPAGPDLPALEMGPGVDLGTSAESGPVFETGTSS
jgi:hypothetical protein